MSDNIVKSEWSNKIYPCAECDYIGPLDAFKYGACYKPCPACGGAKMEEGKAGRFVYKIEKRLFSKRKVFLRVEWRDGRRKEVQIRDERNSIIREKCGTGRL